MPSGSGSHTPSGVVPTFRSAVLRRPLDLGRRGRAYRIERATWAIAAATTAQRSTSTPGPGAAGAVAGAPMPPGAPSTTTTTSRAEALLPKESATDAANAYDPGSSESHRNEVELSRTHPGGTAGNEIANGAVPPNRETESV